MSEKKCGMYDENNCPIDCDDSWPTCDICGATLPFWDGDYHGELNGFIIIESGIQCCDRELEGDEYTICKNCFENRVKPMLAKFLAVEKFDKF